MSEAPGGLELRAVSRDYDGTQVLAPVSMVVPEGCCVALVGSNGAGKSTLLRVATGREPPSTGRVVWRGRRLRADDPRARRDFAVLQGVLSCYSDLTVRQHLQLLTVAHQADPAGIAPALERWGLTGHSELLPHQLSSGLRQRMGLASLGLRPRRALVLDEPEQHLDAAARADLSTWVRAEVGAGRVVLLASHDPDVVSRCADHVVTMEAGSCTTEAADP